MLGSIKTKLPPPPLTSPVEVSGSFVSSIKLYSYFCIDWILITPTQGRGWGTGSYCYWWPCCQGVGSSIATLAGSLFGWHTIRSSEMTSESQSIISSNNGVSPSTAWTKPKSQRYPSVTAKSNYWGEGKEENFGDENWKSCLSEPTRDPSLWGPPTRGKEGSGNTRRLQEVRFCNFYLHLHFGNTRRLQEVRFRNYYLHLDFGNTSRLREVRSRNFKLKINFI